MKQTLTQILEQDCTNFVKIEKIKNLILDNSEEVIGYLLYDLTVMGLLNIPESKIDDILKQDLTELKKCLLHLVEDPLKI